MYKKEEFQATLAVKGTMIGRAPVAVSESYVALADRSGLFVQVYDAKDSKYKAIHTLKVTTYPQKISQLVTQLKLFALFFSKR